MVIIERKNLVRVLLFLVVTLSLVWYVASKRNDFSQTALPDNAGSKMPESVVRPASVPVTAPVQPRLLEKDFFVEYKMERDRLRAQQLELLQSLVSNDRVDGSSRQEAGKKIVALTENLAKEMEIESLLEAKGFEEALAFLHNSNAEVVVKSQVELGQGELAAIADVIKRSTGLKPDRVSVIARP